MHLLPCFGSGNQPYHSDRMHVEDTLFTAQARASDGKVQEKEFLKSRFWNRVKANVLSLTQS